MLKNICPKYIKKYRKKKHLQNFVKAVIGVMILVSILAATVAGICAVVGLALLGTVISKEAELAAAVGAGYGTVVLGVIETGVAAGAITGFTASVGVGIADGLACQPDR